MADYVLPNGAIGAHNKTLAAGVVDTVTFALGSPDSPGWAQVPSKVEILTNGVADIYVTADGTAPTVEGSHCYRIPAAASATVLDVRDQDPENAVVIKLISAGAPTYSVSRAG